MSDGMEDISPQSPAIRMKEAKWGTVDHPSQESLRDIVSRALEEDISGGDITSELLIDEAVTASGQFVSRDDGVVAGLPCVAEVYRQLGHDLVMEFHVSDGEQAPKTTAWATIRGSARGILAGERVALNLLGRLSGIATLTRRFVDAVAGTRARIFDTRKTTPLLRVLEKYAVAAGRGVNHRRSLHDQVLIKDNHLAALDVSTGDRALRVARAVQKAKGAAGGSRYEGVIEVEVDCLDEVLVAARAGADIILLDNFTITEMSEAVRRLDETYGQERSSPRSGRRPELEASGGVRLEAVAAIARTGVERISVGALTHSAHSLDIGLDFFPHDAR